MTIIKHELKENIKSLIVWSTIIGGMIIMFMLMFPAFKDQMEDMVKMYANLGSFSAAFGINRISFATALGFYGIEAGTIFSLGGALFAALTGSAALSKEEDKHTAEFLLTHPISRAQAVFNKLVFVVLQVLLINLVCFACGLLSFAIIGETAETKNLLLYHAAQLIMQLEIACICFCVSAFQKKSNTGLGLGFASVLYFIGLLVNASEKAEKLKYITPFQYSDATLIFSEGKLDGLLIGIGCAIAAVCIILAFIRYCKKDIAA